MHRLHLNTPLALLPAAHESRLPLLPYRPLKALRERRIHGALPQERTGGRSVPGRQGHGPDRDPCPGRCITHLFLASARRLLMACGGGYRRRQVNRGLRSIQSIRGEGFLDSALGDPRGELFFMQEEESALIHHVQAGGVELEMAALQVPCPAEMNGFPGTSCIVLQSMRPSSGQGPMDHRNSRGTPS